MKILFVCTGNTCRSPMAEGLFTEIIRSKGMKSEDFTVVSAGLMTIDGVEASEYSVRVLLDKGINISGHLSKRLTDDMVEEADLILTMTLTHKIAVTMKNDKAIGKTYTLKEFAGYTDGDMDISDPFGMDIDAYKECAEEILMALEISVKKITGELI
ncbi:MAG: low molecular weight protein arginine phosphatase [Dethiosulfatibacter sp.]|nr:low molecular weight protein arginine phosphatase [Dethiosulfatibacter sp.]